MKLVQFIDRDGQHVGVVEGDRVADLTQTEAGPRSVYEVYYRLGGSETGLVDAAQKLLAGAAKARRLDLQKLLDNRDTGEPCLVKPVSGPADAPHALRIWLAGVTHEDSAKLREVEAKQATGESVNVYDQKYRECAGGGRPELFSKNDPYSVVGHGQPVTRPEDTRRMVPETELVSVYGLNAKGQIERIGYTGGNDVTDNGIEADNPLNLPQAKNWADGCASLGPVLVTADDFDDRVVTVSCEILRDGKRVAFKEGDTGRDRLNMPDRLFHLEKALFSRVPLLPGQLQAFYWGTPIVFSEKDFKTGLLVGDLMRLSFSGGIGTLENPVEKLATVDQLSLLRS